MIAAGVAVQVSTFQWNGLVHESKLAKKKRSRSPEVEMHPSLPRLSWSHVTFQTAKVQKQMKHCAQQNWTVWLKKLSNEQGAGHLLQRLYYAIWT